MNKAELIRFLEPFDDEIKIYVSIDGGWDILAIDSAEYEYRSTDDEAKIVLK